MSKEDVEEILEEMFDTEYMTGAQPNLNKDWLRAKLTPLVAQKSDTNTSDTWRAGYLSGQKKEEPGAAYGKFLAQKEQKEGVECCLKCNQWEYLDYAAGNETMVQICGDTNCPCHTPTPTVKEESHTQGIAKTEKAFGGCKKCYGKGYYTNIKHWEGHGEWDIGQGGVHVYQSAPYYNPCDCDRGKQFASAMASEREAGRLQGIADAVAVVPKGMRPEFVGHLCRYDHEVICNEWNACRQAMLTALCSLTHKE